MLMLVVLLVGCTRELDTATVTVDGHRFDVEIARTGAQIRDGLSGRDQLPAGHGMLFEFDGTSEQQVWMPEMNFAIDIAWIADGSVLRVDTLQPCTLPDQDHCRKWTSPAPVDALLEVPADALDGVEAGDQVRVSEPDR